MNGDVRPTITACMNDARYWRGGEGVLIAIVEAYWLPGDCMGYAWIWPVSSCRPEWKKIGEFVA